MSLRPARLAAVLAVAAVLAGCTATPPSAQPDAAPSVAPATSPSASPLRIVVDGIVLPTYWRPHVDAAPTGRGVERASALPAGRTLTGLFEAVRHGDAIAFGPGEQRFSDFAAPVAGTANGVVLPPTLSGLFGSGVGRTVFAMAPGTSTHAADIPTTFPQTNQLSLMMVDGGSPVLSGFTLKATDQGHLYNGLRVSRTTGMRLSDVRVAGIPGASSSPPGETFAVNDYRTTGSVYTRLEVDGAGVGASGFGVNGSENVTIEDSYLHGEAHSMGAAFWQVRNIRATDVITTHDRVGFNFERVSGSVVLTRPVMAGNPRGDIRIASDQGSARYTIIDPVFTGSKLVVVVPKTYYGHPNLQDRAAIRVVVDGVDRTDRLLQIVTSR